MGLRDDDRGVRIPLPAVIKVQSLIIHAQFLCRYFLSLDMKRSINRPMEPEAAIP